MKQWQREFIAQLKMGIPPERACRSAAGMSLKEVLDCKEADPEFSNAWDDVSDPFGGRGRSVARAMTGETLEALLWAQCDDEQTAAYFNLETGEMLAKIENDPELKRIHKLARKGGQAQVKMLQMNEAAAGNGQMAIWLGKQYVGQADKQDHTMKVEAVPMDTAELARRLLVLLEENNLTTNHLLPPPIDVQFKEIIEVLVDDE